MNYTDIVLKILGKEKFGKMMEKFDKDDKNLKEELCEAIFLIGISKAYREDLISEKIKSNIKKLCKQSDVIEEYKEYINEIIAFLVKEHDKHSKEHLNTELDKFVENYKIDKQLQNYLKNT